jgi:streptogramin lyase
MHSQCRYRRSRPSRRLLRLEVLEDRCLLSSINEFPLPNPHSFPAGITKGPDGNVWFTENQANQIGRIAPDGSITEFPLPAPNHNPLAITAGPDGNLWFTEALGSGYGIGRITPDGSITGFPVPSNFGSSLDITAGPDGNLWFPETDAGTDLGQIGRITPDGQVTEFRLPGFEFYLFGIAAGPDGNLWFTETSTTTFRGDQIGRITPDGQVTEFPTPTPYGQPAFITAGPDGNLWYTEQDANLIGRLTPDGHFSEFPLSGPGVAFGITAGPDGNVWFTHGNNIGQITPAGTVTDFPIPTTNSGNWGITTGADGNIWFTETAAGQIGQLVLDGGNSGQAMLSHAPSSAAVGRPTVVPAVDALFAGARPESMGNPVVGQTPAPAVAAAPLARQVEAFTPPGERLTLSDDGTVPHHHKGHRIVAVNTVELADPLVEAL